MKCSWNRREWMSVSLVNATAWLSGFDRGSRAGSVLDRETDGERLARGTLDFIVRCRRPDGGYAPSARPDLHRPSRTRSSATSPP